MEKFLSSVDPTFECFVTVIEEIKDLEAMTMEKLLRSLQAYEEKNEEGRYLRPSIQDASRFT